MAGEPCYGLYEALAFTTMESVPQIATEVSQHNRT